jgi:hypothetical protein
MKITNIHLKSIEARRYSRAIPPRVRIDHNSTVTLFSFNRENRADVEFEYTASYGSLGVIKLEGSLIYEGSDAKEIANRWGNKRQMPNEVASNIHTAIMHSCVPEAVGIAKDLNLPPPIPLPKVNFGKKKEGKIGPEFA